MVVVVVVDNLDPNVKTLETGGRGGGASGNGMKMLDCSRYGWNWWWRRWR